MTNSKQARLRNLGEVEQVVMDYIWSHGPVTAERCREGLAPLRPMKDSTIRTVLRRLQEKGYVTHEVEGRTFIYRAEVLRDGVRASMLSELRNLLFGGSPALLLHSMVNHTTMSADDAVAIYTEE